MGLFRWSEEGIKKFKWYDISILKLSAGAGMLTLAKLWPPLLSLAWYWYAIIAVVLAVYLMTKMSK
jgi:hypothetical protein